MGLILHSFPVHTKDLHVSGKQKRNVVQEGKNGGQCSGSAIKNCNLNPVNECKWGQWETCSTTCGPGIQTRLIDQEASHCGKNCFGSDTKSCNLKKCPIVQPSIDKQVNCKWGKWGACSRSCGPGIQTRYAEIQVQNGGRPCFGERIKKCNLKPCLENPPVDCKWSPWSNCDAECGPGEQTRHIEQPARFGGKECKGRNKQYCLQKSCRMNCLWTEWSACSTSCGPGIQRRRLVSQNPYDFHSCIGGEEMACNEKPCLGKNIAF